MIAFRSINPICQHPIGKFYFLPIVVCKMPCNAKLVNVVLSKPAIVNSNVFNDIICEFLFAKFVLHAFQIKKFFVVKAVDVLTKHTESKVVDCGSQNAMVFMKTLSQVVDCGIPCGLFVVIHDINRL